MSFLKREYCCNLNRKVFFIVSFLFLLVFSVTVQAEKKLNVLTTTTSLKSLVESVAGDKVYVESITKGPQDPHFLSAKPSYMVKARKADLLIVAGLDLEVGWLPNIVHGARNPQIQKGQSGYLDASQFIKALSVPKGKVDRFFGDVHPFGNPHFILDPVRGVKVSKEIGQRLSLLDPENKKHYMENQKQFEKNIMEKMKAWERRIKNSGVTKIVTYHSSFEYFLDRFNLNLVGLIEEKPGIPPSVKHILQLIKKMKDTQSSCILMSSFYRNDKIKKIEKALPVRVETVSIEVGALKKAKNYELVIEGVVEAIENCGQFDKDKNTNKNKNKKGKN